MRKDDAVWTKASASFVEGPVMACLSDPPTDMYSTPATSETNGIYSSRYMDHKTPGTKAATSLHTTIEVPQGMQQNKEQGLPSELDLKDWQAQELMASATSK